MPSRSSTSTRALVRGSTTVTYSIQFTRVLDSEKYRAEQHNFLSLPFCYRKTPHIHIDGGPTETGLVRVDAGLRALYIERNTLSHFLTSRLLAPRQKVFQHRRCMVRRTLARYSTVLVQNLDTVRTVIRPTTQCYWASCGPRRIRLYRLRQQTYRT